MTDDKNDFDDDDSLGAGLPKDVPGGSFTAKLLGDLAKRALTTGIGAVFMSEETLRSQLSEMKLPKEAMGYVVSQADKTKRELIDVIARETRAFFARLEVEDMIARALTGTTIEITTRVRILPKEGGGMALAVDQNDANLVKSQGEADAPSTSTSTSTATSKATTDATSERPRRRKRRKDDGSTED